MGLIDSHAHLTFPELRNQVDDILDRCAASGVDAVITVGTDLADARAAVDLARHRSGTVHAAVGFHPHEAAKIPNDDFSAMSDLWNDPCVVGLGEMGLDYHYEFAPHEKQREVFAKQLELAAALEKPVVIHNREALDDTIALLSDHGFGDRPVVFHCFTGTAEDAARIAGHGWRISFTGIVTFRKSVWLQEIAKEYPADRLMVETDSPYLSPVPVRGKHPNEPSFVPHTARFLADLRGESFEAFTERTESATRAFFGI